MADCTVCPELVLPIQIWIRMIHMFLDTPDLDQLVRGPGLSIIKQNSRKNLASYSFVTLLDFLSLKNDVNQNNEQKIFTSHIY